VNPAKPFLRWGVALVFFLAASAVLAQAYPVKPVKLIVPFAPGGVGDLTARVLAQKMSESMGQQVIVDNRPGAGGIVASDAVAKAEPDGYTLLFMTNGNAVSAALFKSLPYDTLKDFAPVSTAAYFDILLLVNADAPYKTVAELLAWAKANPGKLNIGTINIGSTQNLAAELFRSLAGIDAQIVPFKATPDVVTAMKRGDVQLAFEFLAAVKGQIQAGAVKTLAVGTDKRFTGLPGVPTVAESGLPGYIVNSWNGFAAPAKTPRAVVERINKEIHSALGSADVRQRLLELSVVPHPGTPEAMQELLASDIAKWKTVIEKAKIEKQ
jgi:tripartite-type tricarboxylate transporter receptor subunit TctC